MNRLIVFLTLAFSLLATAVTDNPCHPGEDACVCYERIGYVTTRNGVEDPHFKDRCAGVKACKQQHRSCTVASKIDGIVACSQQLQQCLDAAAPNEH